MAEFSLRIVTPEAEHYHGMAEQLVVRTVTGDVGILPGHMHYVAPLGKGKGFVTAQGQKRQYACRGGMISVLDENVTLVAESFKWLDVADEARVAAERPK